MTMSAKKRASLKETPREECITSPLIRSSQKKISNSNSSVSTSSSKRKSQKTSSTSTLEMASPLKRSSQKNRSGNDVPERTSFSNRRSQRTSSSSTAETASPLNRRSQKKLSGTGSEGASLSNRLQKKRSDSDGLQWTTPPQRTSQKSSGNSSSEKCRLSNKTSEDVTSVSTTSDTSVPAPIVRRQITAKKIMPRKTLLSIASLAPVPTPKVFDTTAAPRRSSRISPKFEKENTIFDNPQSLSKDWTEHSVPKVDVLSPIPLNISLSPTQDRDKLMSQKVRRSYSRLDMSLNGSVFLYSPTKNTSLSDSSTPNSSAKSKRKSLFGFNKLLSSETPEEELSARKDNKAVLNKSSAVDASVEEPDPNIPGVALAKPKRRKRKIPLIEKSQLDEWAALMNAEFDEAEKFDLFVE